MKQHKILIIEDEIKVAAFLRKGLEEQYYSTEVASNGLSGVDKAATEKFDLAILDVKLPGINGFDVCREIRSTGSAMPVLMLTALGTTEDKLEGFDSGADDYLVKPFEFKELLARVRALLKRAGQASASDHILKVADLEMNLSARTVKRHEIKIELTAKEFQLLEYFIRNKGKVLSRVQIAEHVWDLKFDTGTNVIDVYVNFLRNKIDKKFRPKLIQTVVGMGYILSPEENEHQG
jgi:two-component system copper resistance phosphate regulon response regulator CusR